MLVGVFAPSHPSDHVASLSAFAEGLKARGVDHFMRGMTYRKCDVAVVFGVRKDRVPVSYARGQVIADHNGPHIVLEKGFVRRDEYFHVGWNGLNGRADFRNQGMPADRWKKLGVELQPRKHGEKVVVCGQVPWDASVQHTNHIQWCQKAVAELNRITRREVVFRPHPKAGIDYGVNCPVSLGSLAEDLSDAHAVVTFNSNSAVEALIEGVPVFAFDKGSMALRVANTDLYDIDNPRFIEREPWASDLAYAQWSLDEMSSGECWDHIGAG